MDFGLDNEFDSDDSFFNDPKISKKTQKPVTTEKKSLEDIFGFEDDKKLEKSGPSSLENIQNSPVAKPKVRFNIEDTSTTEISEKTPESSKTKLPDWLGGTSGDTDIFKPPKTDSLDNVLFTAPSKTESKKSFDLLDDLLPQRNRNKTDQNKTASFEDILRESKAQKSGPASLEKQNFMEREEHSTKTTSKVLEVKRNPSEGISMILEAPQGPRRGRRGSSAGVSDVLGLFSSSGPASSEFPIGPSAVSSSIEEKRSSSRGMGKDMPDWLGGSSTTLNKSDTTVSSLHKEGSSRDSETDLQKKVERDTKLDDVHIFPDKSDTKRTKENPQIVPENTPTTQLQTSNFQSNMSNLQTQESFLLVSLQLKKYEENLSEIKVQQKEILQKQEDQFDRFLSKYIEKQKGIEQEMLAQQERINEHIRILALGGFNEKRNIKIHQGHIEEDQTDNEEENESNILDKVVKNLKQRHEEEFFLMEESYKKQISLLEKSSDQIEQRLNQELSNISKIHDEKLNNLKTQHNEEIKYWTEKIKTIDNKHKEEIEEIKENHSRILREVKDEFLDQIERFKEQKFRETELFSNSTDVSQKLKFSLEKLSENEKILEHIQEKVVSDYNILSIAREKSIENKEKEVAAMRVALEKCRDQAEKDRSQLLALVRTLEQKISEQNQNSQEERWALQQAAATIAARSAAFEREVEFSRSSIEREREQLKTLKEALLAEQERATMQLTEEKLKLTAEKSRLEVSAKLVNNYEVEKIRTEAETAIQVAKELTENLTLERSFVQRQKVELDAFRNKLMEKERGLLEREENIEEMRRSMQQKNTEERRVIQETKYLENRYKDKLTELQSQAISLSNREKKLAEEKLLLSKEKLELYTTMKIQSTQKKCMLCRAEDDHRSTKTDPLFIGHTVTDPEFIRLRIETAEEEKNSEVSREDITPNTLQNELKIG